MGHHSMGAAVGSCGGSLLELPPLPLSAVAMGVAVGIVNVFLFFPLLVRFLPGLRYWGPIHHRPISDIPGVPENYDEAVISCIMTLPDPNNFLSAYSFLPLADGVAFTCRMPKCRYYSLTLYAGVFDPVQDKLPPSLTDHEIAHNADGSFDVVISETRPTEGTKGASNWLPSQGIQDGLLVLRRYGTLPGQAVECPSFRRLSDGRLLKPAHRSYSGAHHAQSNGDHRFARLLRVLRFMALASLALLLAGMPLAHVNVAVAIAALVLVSVNSLLYRVGRRRATSMLAAKTKGVLHEAIEPTLEFDSASARPHPAHKYYVVAFDARTHDVAIRGSVLPREQKFWDLCIYSAFGLPHVQCFTDETIIFASEKASGNEGRGYQVVLTRHPQAWEGEPNVVDVSEAPEGAVLVRLIYPTSDEVFHRSRPEVELLPPRGSSGRRGKTKKDE